MNLFSCILLKRNQELTNENNELYKKIEEINDKNLSLKQEVFIFIRKKISLMQINLQIIEKID